MTRFTTIVRAAALASLLLPALASAYVESSCPAPCPVGPKTSLFMRETNGTLGIAGQADALIGTMGKGVHNRVLRIDATMTVFMEHAFLSLDVKPWLNDLEPYPGAVNVPSIAVTACDWNKTSTCTVTGSFWFDLDALDGGESWDHHREAARHHLERREPGRSGRRSPILGVVLGRAREEVIHRAGAVTRRRPPRRFVAHAVP